MKPLKILLLICSIFAICLCTCSCGKKNMNVILVIGDGMGNVHEEYARYVKKGDLSWDSFPVKGKVNTFSLSTVESDDILLEVATDSAASATAMSTGVRTINRYTGRDADGNDLKNIMEIATEKGYKTGAISTDKLTGATIAAFSSHTNGREMPVLTMPSQSESPITLLMGSDFDKLFADESSFSDYAKQGFKFAGTMSALDKKHKRIVAGFAATGAVENNAENVSLKDMTAFALDYLSQKNNSFCLMVEGGKIDHYSHDNIVDGMVYELLALDKTVEYIVEWAERRKDTMVIVTADHETGSLVFNKDTIAQDKENSIYFRTMEHSNSEVNYYVYGHNNPELMKENILNTDIFRMCNEIVCG